MRRRVEELSRVEGKEKIKSVALRVQHQLEEASVELETLLAQVKGDDPEIPGAH